jgi:tRNA U34 5-methylaminomethyl-2-thiouridine-forming methyltransferase MnmC
MANSDAINEGGQHQIIVCEDGSHTLYVPQLQEHYHSTHGAVNESMHVFIQMGLLQHSNASISILEVGFGTGLNALLTLVSANEKSIYYHAVEKYPLCLELVGQLNYGIHLPGCSSLYHQLHQSLWGEDVKMTSSFTLHKTHADLRAVELVRKYDLVYFDAFAPSKQPDLWQIDVFANIFRQMNPKGILVTYCAKGSVRRMLKEVGFFVERLPGPPGKREMLRAIRLV